MAEGAILTWEIKDKTSRLVAISTAIPIDIMHEEAVEKRAEVTKYPVEVGAKPSDHHRPENAKIRLKARVLSYPVSITGGGIASQTTVDEADGQGAQASYNSLDAARINSYLVKMTTPQREYTNCLITNLSYAQDSKTGVGAMLLDIEMEQQRFVELKLVTTKKLPVNAKNNVCAGNTDKGAQTGGNVEKEKRATLLRQGLKAVTPKVFKK